MNKTEVRKIARLNETDRKILTVYSDMSLETGAKIPAAAVQTNNLLHKSAVIKV